MTRLIHLGVLTLAFKLGLSIDQVSPLDSIVFAYDNEASLALNDFFEGQNLTYSSMDGLSISQRLELVQSIDRNTTIDSSRQIGLIETDQASNYLFTLETRSFTIWDTSNIQNLTLLSTVTVNDSSLLVSLSLIQLAKGYPIRVALINQNKLNYTLHVFDISDISNVHEIEGLRITVEGLDPVVKVSSSKYGQDFFVETSGSDTNLDLININSAFSDYQRVRKESAGLDEFYAVGIGKYFKGNKFICDMNNGIIEFTISHKMEFLVLNIQRDPLSYGEIFSCFFNGLNVTVATAAGILVYSLPDLSFMNKYHRYPSPTESYDLKDSPRVLSHHNLIGTYCVTDDISFRIIDISKGLTQSILLDEYVSQLFESQTPMYTIIKQDGLSYVIFARTGTLEIYRIFEKPYIHLPAISRPTKHTGKLFIKNSFEYLEPVYQIQRIDSSSLEIRDWRGPYPDFGFIKVDTLQFMVGSFMIDRYYLPISNYFSGQDMELSVALIESPGVYSLEIELYNQIYLENTIELPEFSGENPKLYSSSFIYGQSMLAVPGTSEYGYLLKLDYYGNIALTNPFNCADISRNMTDAIIVSYGSDVYLIAECTGKDIVWDFLAVQSTWIEYLDSIVSQKKNKIMIMGSHLLSMDDHSISIHLFDPNSDNILINLQMIDSSTFLDFSPIEMVSNESNSLLVYDKHLGLIQFNVTNWNPPFEYNVIGKLSNDTGEQVKLTHDFEGFYGFVPQNDGSNGIFKFFVQENKVEIVQRYPDFNKNYTEIFSLGRFIFIASEDNHLSIFDKKDYSFEVLIKCIPISSKFSFIGNLNQQQHIYVYHSNRIDTYGILHPDEYIKSNLVPSKINIFNSYLSLKVDTANIKLVDVDSAKLEITAKNSTFQTSTTVNIDIYSSVNTVQENVHFNKKSNLLTYTTEKHVKSGFTEELPLDYFIGNDIHFVLESQETDYYIPQPSCNSSTPICLEEKVFEKSTLTAYDFTHNNNSLYMISGTEIIEYSLNATDWVYETSYDLKSMLGEVLCKRIEYIPFSARIFLISCEYPNYSLELSTIDLNSQKIIASTPIFMHSKVMHIDSSRIYAFDGARLTIYEYNYLDHRIESYIVLTSESFNLDSFEVVGIETNIQGTYILFTSQDILLVKYPSQIISSIQLKDVYHDIGTPSISSGIMLSDKSTIYVVDNYSALYKFKIEDLSFQQLEEWPYFSYDDESLPCKLGVSENYSMIAFPLQDNVEHEMRFLNYSKTPLNYIYNQYKLPRQHSSFYSCKSILIELEDGLLNVYGNLKDERTEFYVLSVNPRPKLHVYPSSDINKTSISLIARSFANMFASGNLTLNFIPPDEDTHGHGITSEWWFWLLISIGVIVFIGILAVLVIRRVKKRRANVPAQDYSLKEAIELTENFSHEL